MLTLQIVGKKNSGKTTVILTLIRQLRKQGFRVAALKQTHHEIVMDTPGTDSFRFYEAGAEQVGLQGSQQFLWHERSSNHLNELIHQQISKGIDILLIEGFKNEAFPKLVLLRPNDEIHDFSLFEVKGFATIYPAKVTEKIRDLSNEEKIQQWFNESMMEGQNEMDELTHFNEQNRAKMVDVSEKQANYREATAQTKIQMQTETFQRIKKGEVAKGDVLAVAQVAGIMAAKRTSELIPMCHLLPLSGVDIRFSDNGKNEVTIQATVKTVNVTGVEMEALLAAQVTALTIYDMCKAMDKAMVIRECHLVEKHGGKSGDFYFEQEKK